MRIPDPLLAIAQAQNGLFRADQARSCGATREWIAHHVGERLSRILPGTYWLKTGPPPRRVLYDAALLYAGPDALLSHWTAAEIWRFRDVSRPEIHVTTPLSQHLVDVPGVLTSHRSVDLAPAVSRIRGGRRLTSVDRTVVDLATTDLSLRDVRALAADAVQRGKTLPRRIAAEMARRPSLPGLERLAEVLFAVSDGARSVLEVELRSHLVAAGVTDAVHGRPVFGASGKRYWADNLWPQHQLIVEVDGREWHLSPDDWERDLARMTDLAAAGYRLLRFSAIAIRRRTANTVQTVRRTLAVAAAS